MKNSLLDGTVVIFAVLISAINKWLNLMKGRNRVSESEKMIM
jgi:hypothetical protein